MLKDFFITIIKFREMLLLSLKFQCFLLCYCNEKYYTQRNCYILREENEQHKKKDTLLQCRMGYFAQKEEK